jgi:hypothetical protein
LTVFTALLALMACGESPAALSPAPTVGAAASALPPAPEPSVSSRAELLANCLQTHPGAGQVRLGVTVDNGRINTAEVRASTADAALTTCLREGILGLPHDGGEEVTLTAL